MDHFEAESPLLFRQIDLFKIIVSERGPIKMYLRNKGKLMREFDIRDLVLLRKQVKSIRKYGIPQKLIKKKGTIQSPREGYTELILASAFDFW